MYACMQNIWEEATYSSDSDSLFFLMSSCIATVLVSPDVDSQVSKVPDSKT